MTTTAVTTAVTTARPHPVLVGLDLAEPVDAALRYAAQEARRHRCGLHLLHVLHPVYVGPPELTALLAASGELRHRADRALAAAAARAEELLGGDLPVTTEVVHGAVVPALVEASSRAGVVVLQHRHRTHGRIVTLSVTNAVAARAHAPVVAVPADLPADDSAGGDAPVVVGVDAGEHAAAVVLRGLREAHARGTGVQLVHAWWFSDVYDDVVFEGDTGRAWSARVQRELTVELAPLLERYPEVQAEVVVGHARPADALVASSARAALLVVGRHHPTLPLGSHLGSIARSVLHEATCPVLVVDPVEDEHADPPRPLAEAAAG